MSQGCGFVFIARILSSYRGRELGDFTFGLNWNLNPNYRVMFNYVFADLKDVGDTHILQMRFQVAF